MTSVHRSRHIFNNLGANHVCVARPTAHGPADLCKFTKCRHEHRQTLRKVVKVAQKPTKTMLNKSSDAILVRAENSITQNPKHANPHSPS
jgi:hypothetical protein